MIKINLNTRIKVLLDMDQQKVIDRLIRLNRNFSKLRNPILRNLLARRVTIAEACKIAGCSPDDFFNSMRSIGFVVEEGIAEKVNTKLSKIDFSRRATVYELDVRQQLYRNQDPLKEILNLTKHIEPGGRIMIINTFEPVPLINLLEEKGFLSYTEILNENLVVTWFEKGTAKAGSVVLKESDCVAQPELFDQVLSRFASDKINYLDVRTLEMPQPMLRILAFLENLKVDELLYVYHKKIPVYLLPELSKKGMIYLLNPKAEQDVEFIIYTP